MKQFHIGTKRYQDRLRTEARWKNDPVLIEINREKRESPTGIFIWSILLFLGLYIMTIIVFTF